MIEQLIVHKIPDSEKKYIPPNQENRAKMCNPLILLLSISNHGYLKIQHINSLIRELETNITGNDNISDGDKLEFDSTLAIVGQINPPIQETRITLPNTKLQEVQALLIWRTTVNKWRRRRRRKKKNHLK
jgi:hypothetical protein